MDDSLAPETSPAAAALTHEADILIIGGGFSGMVMALEARRQGFDDIVILEKADDIGGTWRENTYPGVACDIPSHLYSLATHPKPDWQRRYASGAEIWDYMREVARREDLYALARFGRRFTGAAWDAASGCWLVETSKGENWRARVVISSMGPLHVPQIPELPGLGSFRGRAFHSAEWDDCAKLAGSHVAVIGAGASAGQIVPHVARTAARLTVYQRSAPWVLPHLDAAMPRWLHRLYAIAPVLRRIDRAWTFALQELKHSVFRGDQVAAGLAQRIALWHMARSVQSTALRRRLTPDYRIGCKRILLSNDWYPTLTRPNVEVVTEAIAELREDAVVAADGVVRPAEVLVFATGFRVIDTIAALPFRGRGGCTLADAWVRGAEAYLGTTVAGFPNLFLMLGPNTGLGHNSAVLMAEAQAEHVARLLATMRASGIAAVEPRAKLQEAYCARVRHRLDDTVWQTGGCTSWYKDAQGRNPTIWPGTVREFCRLTRRSGLADYLPVDR